MIARSGAGSLVRSVVQCGRGAFTHAGYRSRPSLPRKITAMKCPHCRHAITYLESFEIVNPWSFDCSSCATPLSVGSRGDVLMALAAAAGAVPGLLFGYLWLVKQLPLASNLSWSAVVFAALVVPVQWFTVRFGDARRSRD
jgi:hypothetical protein